MVMSTNLGELEGVKKGVPLHQEDLSGGAGFEQLHLADAVVLGGEGGWVALALVVRGGEIRRQLQAHVE